MARRLIGGIVALALAASTTAAQQPKTQPHDSGPGMEPGRGMAMMMNDSLNHRLDGLVARMNRATGAAKVDAMAAVINELVKPRKMMMERMHDVMMNGGRMPMMMGDSTPPRPSPAGRADTAAADTTDHAAHHPPQ